MTHWKKILTDADVTGLFRFEPDGTGTLMGSRGLSEDDTTRLDHLGVQLDQCWDLLRQRRARRRAGQDPDLAAVRDEGTVEHYRQ